jgi:shikimate kinase
LIGFMGSGKSTVGRLVAERAGAEFRDLDRLIEAAAGMSIAELWAVKGEAEFRRIESELLPGALAGHSVAALGGGAPLSDGNWKTIQERALSVFLDVPFDQLWSRIRQETHRPLIRGRRPEEVEALLERRRPLYARAGFTVDAAREPEVVAGEVLELWSK